MHGLKTITLLKGMSMFPDNKSFAFTILDDTDDATLENVRPIYYLLNELGMKTTKTAWPMDCPEGSKLYFAAETLQNIEYRDFVRQLIADGFEFASHGATMESSLRQRTQEGFKYIERELHVKPTVYCNHGHNRENIYWGAQRYQSKLISFFYERIHKDRNYYQGQIESSEYFWGDICKEKIQYVRSYAFSRLDISRIKPTYPYQLYKTKFVNNWFITSDAPDVDAFKKLVTQESIDRLVKNNGFTIISTHLGKGFVRNGRIDKTVRNTLEYLSELPGWYVPVGELLRFLSLNIPNRFLSEYALFRLELRHVLDRVFSKFMKHK